MCLYVEVFSCYCRLSFKKLSNRARLCGKGDERLIIIVVLQLYIETSRYRYTVFFTNIIIPRIEECDVRDCFRYRVIKLV